jgi:starvation-inducible DNA-binding protein
LASASQLLKPMHFTKNTLSEKIRVESVGLLQQRLSDSIDLMLQLKQAHWNVRGENFIALHQLFDKVHEVSEEWTDLIAERIAQLGGIAEGTLGVTVQDTSLPEYPLNITNGHDHVETISRSLATYGELVRNGIDTLEEIGDRDAADILTEVSRGVDQYLWMIEAHNSSGKRDIQSGSNKVA